MKANTPNPGFRAANHSIRGIPAFSWLCARFRPQCSVRTNSTSALAFPWTITRTSGSYRLSSLSALGYRCRLWPSETCAWVRQRPANMGDSARRRNLQESVPLERGRTLANHFFRKFSEMEPSRRGPTRESKFHRSSRHSRLFPGGIDRHRSGRPPWGRRASELRPTRVNRLGTSCRYSPNP
jgi:hypothetical protein